MRRAEQAAMFAYGEDGRCLMQALQRRARRPAGRAVRAVLGLRRPALRRAASTPALAREAYALVRSRPIVAEPCAGRRRGPPTSPARRSRPRCSVEEGRALARAGDGGWDGLVAAGSARRAASTTSS